jgi:hypothetical protein
VEGPGTLLIKSMKAGGEQAGIQEGVHCNDLSVILPNLRCRKPQAATHAPLNQVCVPKTCSCVSKATPAHQAAVTSSSQQLSGVLQSKHPAHPSRP